MALESAASVLRCGWLGHSDRGQAPKQGWWVLTAGEALTGHLLPDRPPECAIPLSGISAVGPGNLPHEFRVKTSAGLVHHFLAESEPAADSWRGALEQARRPPVPPARPAPAAEPQPALSQMAQSVLRVKQALVELDLILQALLGALLPPELLSQRFGVHISQSQHDRSRVLVELGLTPDQRLSSARGRQIRAHTAAMLADAEARHRSVLEANPPGGLGPGTLAQIGENTKRLAALSVMIQAVGELQPSPRLPEVPPESPAKPVAPAGALSPQVEHKLTELQSQVGRADMAELQTAYNKLRGYTEEVQTRNRRMESVLRLIQQYVEADADGLEAELVLDNKMAATLEPEQAAGWKQLVHYRLVPGIKAIKQAAAEASSPLHQRNLQLEASLIELQESSEAELGMLREQLAAARSQVVSQGGELPSLREQLALSERYITELTTQMLEGPAQLARLEVAAPADQSVPDGDPLRHQELQQQVSAAERRKLELQQEISALTAQKQRAEQLDEPESGRLRSELARLEALCGQQEQRIEELDRVVEGFEERHAATLEEFEREMAKGYALNMQLNDKYTVLQSQAKSTMQQLRALKERLQEKEEHREDILRQAQSSFNELKEKYVVLERSHQERKHMASTNSRAELSKMVERIQELEVLQSKALLEAELIDAGHDGAN